MTETTVAYAYIQAFVCMALSVCMCVCAATEVLHIHCAVSLSDQLSGALPCPCTSVLWAGPALLALLLDGRVIQVCAGFHMHGLLGRARTCFARTAA